MAKLTFKQWLMAIFQPYEFGLTRKCYDCAHVVPEYDGSYRFAKCRLTIPKSAKLVSAYSDVDIEDAGFCSVDRLSCGTCNIAGYRWEPKKGENE